LIVISRTECCDRCEWMKARLSDVESSASITVDDFILNVSTHLRPPIAFVPDLLEHSGDAEVTMQMSIANELFLFIDVLRDDLSSLMME